MHQSHHVVNVYSPCYHHVLTPIYSIYYIIYVLCNLVRNFLCSCSFVTLHHFHSCSIVTLHHFRSCSIVTLHSFVTLRFFHVICIVRFLLVSMYLRVQLVFESLKFSANFRSQCSERLPHYFMYLYVTARVGYIIRYP